MNMSRNGQALACAPLGVKLRRTSNVVLTSLLLVVSVVIVFGGSVATAQTYKGPNMNYTYSGPRVSEADVLANPTDPTLNLNYARQQSAAGDLMSAASTLERMLALQPNWHSARLFYAAVLYRLDDRQAANRELELLEGKNLNESQTITYNDYRAAFQDAPPVTAQRAIDGRLVDDILAEQDARAALGQGSSDMALISPSTESLFDGRVVAGLRYDDNAGNAIDDVAIAQNSRDDISAFLQGAVRGSMMLAENNRVRAHGSLNGQVRRHDDFDDNDYDTVSARAGLTAYTANLRASLTAEYAHDQIDIAGESYLTQNGPRAIVRFKATPDLTLGLTAALYDQDYDNLTASPFESNRSGDKSVILASLSTQLNDKIRLGFSAGLENKTARDTALAYDAVRFSAHYTQALTSVVDLKAVMRYRRASFDDVGATGVNENRLNGRIALATPLSTVLPAITSSTGPTLEAGINYNQRDIDLGGADYDNLGGEVRLTWDF